MNRTFYIEAGTNITTMTQSFWANPLDRIPYDPEAAAQNTDKLCLAEGWALDEDCLLDEEDDLLVFSLPSVPVFLVSKEDVRQEAA